MNIIGRMALGVLGLIGLIWIGSSLSDTNGSSGTGVLYYRSPMHPWVTSERPGQCTVCGMDLVPVYRPSESGGTNSLFVGPFSSATVTNASIRDLSRTLKVSGKLVPDRTKIRVVAAEVSGRLEEVHLESVGQEVSRGDRLYTIYSPVLREAERDYHLLYQQSQMNHSSKITAEHARLLKAMRLRLKEYGLSEKQIAAIPQKQDDASTTDMLSPVDGVIVSLNKKTGDRVSVGSELMRIADVYQPWFEFDVYEDDIANVKIGQTIRVSVSGGLESSSVIIFINELIQGSERRAKGRAVLRNPTLRRDGAKYRAYTIGSYAEGGIELKVSGKLSLPREAFLNVGDGYVVFVHTKVGFVRRDVSVGFRGDRYWEVAGGLKADEEVVIQGNLLLESEFRL